MYQRSAQFDHRQFLGAVAFEIRPRTFLEVGVREGDSLRAVILNAPWLERIALCDTWGPTFGGTGRGSHDHIRDVVIPDACYSGAVDWLDGPSAEQLPALDQRDPFDLVHIDGDHSTEGAALDLRHGWPLARVCLVVHDVFMPQVWIAVSDFLSRERPRIAHVALSAADSGTVAVWRADR